MASDIVPSVLSFHKRKKFMYDVKRIFWDKTYLYRSCLDCIIRHCVPKVEMLSILEACLSSPIGENHSGTALCIRLFSIGTIGQNIINNFTSSVNHMVGDNEMEVFQRGKASIKSYSRD